MNEINSPRFGGSEVFLLHELVSRLDGFSRRRTLGPLGLTFAEFMILLGIQFCAPSTQEAVGNFASMSKSLVSQRVGVMVKKGLVFQERNSSDRREVFLRLTTEGLGKLSKSQSQLNQSSETLLGHLGTDREAFRSALVTLIEVLKNEE